MNALSVSRSRVAEPSHSSANPQNSKRGGFFILKSKQPSQAPETGASKSEKKTITIKGKTEKSLDQLREEDVERLKRYHETLDRLEARRCQILSAASEFHSSIRKTFSSKRAEKTAVLSQGNTETGVKVPRSKSASIGQKNVAHHHPKMSPANVAELGPKFFEEAMIEGLIAKAKGNKNSIGPTDKFSSIESKYKYVQQRINQVVADMLDQKDKAKLDKETQKRLQVAKFQVEDKPFGSPDAFNFSLRSGKSSPKSTRSKDRWPGSNKSFSLGSPFRARQRIKSQQTDPEVNFMVEATQDLVKEQARLRRKIDKVYMKFAKKPEYAALYNLARDRLKQQSSNFLVESSKPRYFPEIDDYFIDGEDMRYIQPTILTAPLINTYLATNSKKFVQRKEQESSDEENYVISSD